MTSGTATLSNGGSGTVTLSGITVLQNELIDAHGPSPVDISLDHFALFGVPGKINISTGGGGVSKILNVTNNAAGTAPFWCRLASSDSDPNGNIIVWQTDTALQTQKIHVDGTAGSDFCDITFGTGNASQTIAANQNAQRGSGKNFVKSGPLSYTLSGDFNSATDFFWDTQDGGANFKTPAHRWAWDMSGAEASPDTGSGSTLCLKRQIASGSLTNVMCFDRTTGNATFAGGISATNLPANLASGTLSLATTAIASGACQTVTEGSVNSAAATGVLTTDVINFTPNASIKAVTGYTPAANGGLTITAYPTAGYVNFDVCNWTSGSITPGAITLNWRVAR